MIEHKKIKFIGVLLTLGMLLSGSVLAQEQKISLQEEQTPNGEREAIVFYQVSDDELTTGIGFRVHFSSGKVNVLELESYLELSNVGIDIMADTQDLDQDPNTDFYINAAWVDLNGEWPEATTMPVKLYSFTFDAIAVPASALFTISQSSTPVGFDFVSAITNK